MAASGFRFQGLSVTFLRNCTVNGTLHTPWRLKYVVQAANVPHRKFHSSVRNNEKPKQLEVKDDVSLERFIPITRRSVVRHMIQAKEYLNADELSRFNKFAERLDSVVIRRYHNVLQELKMLFDPINPDKNTILTRQLNRKDRMDNEFWLVNKLSGVMSKANFTELDHEEIDKIIKDKKTSHGVRVSVNPNKYDMIRVWVLGKESKSLTNSPFGLGGSQVVYQRVVLAVRMKKDEKLMLKAFKDIPINKLDQILPERKLKMSQPFQAVIASSLGLASFGLAAKFTAYLGQGFIQWPLVLSAISGLVAVRTYTMYKNRCLAYMETANKHLYYNNISNNRGLLALLVDRAEDELFKEALLAYTFLLTHRQPSIHDKKSEDQVAEELGNVTPSELEKIVEGWVYRRTGAKVRFDSTDALKFLDELGLIQKDLNNDILNVLPLDVAIRNLPLTSQSLVARDDDTDIIEGYDRDAFDKWIDDSDGQESSLLDPITRLIKKPE